MNAAAGCLECDPNQIPVSAEMHEVWSMVIQRVEKICWTDRPSSLDRKRVTKLCRGDAGFDLARFPIKAQLVSIRGVCSKEQKRGRGTIVRNAHSTASR